MRGQRAVMAVRSSDNVPMTSRGVEVERGVQDLGREVLGEPCRPTTPRPRRRTRVAGRTSRRPRATLDRCRARRADPSADGRASAAGRASAWTPRRDRASPSPSADHGRHRCGTRRRRHRTRNRRMSRNSSRTSGFSQLRSGCFTSNRCRYHSPSGSRGASMPSRRTPTPSRWVAARRVRPVPAGRWKRARSADPGGEASAA